MVISFLIPAGLLLLLSGVWILIWRGSYDPVKDDGFTPLMVVRMAQIHSAIALACLCWLVWTKRKWQPLFVWTRGKRD